MDWVRRLWLREMCEQLALAAEPYGYHPAAQEELYHELLRGML